MTLITPHEGFGGLSRPMANRAARTSMGWDGTRPHFEGGLPENCKTWQGRSLDGYKQCFRVYPNGSWAYEPRSEEELHGVIDNAAPDCGWREYNERARPGCAQFVDGVCVYQGIGFTPEKLAWVEKRLAEGKPPTNIKVSYYGAWED